jgi:tetratricopeptide (TPR) repeat protein
LELEVQIVKGRSVAASLSGIFLDPVPPVGHLYRAMKDLWTDPRTGASAALSEALESLRQSQETAGMEFYRDRAAWQAIQEQAQRTVSEADAPAARAEAWLSVAEACQQLGAYDELAHAFAQAMALAQSTLNPEALAERAAQEANRSLAEKRFLEATLWADARLAAWQKLGPWTKAAEALQEQAWQYRFIDRRYAMSQLERWLELTQHHLSPEELKKALLAEARYWRNYPRRCRDYAIHCWEAARVRFGPEVLSKEERLELSRAYLHLNADDLARWELEQLVEGGERDELTAEAHSLLAVCELRANRPEKAKEMYFQILERYPNTPAAEAAAQTLERRFYRPEQTEAQEAEEED